MKTYKSSDLTHKRAEVLKEAKANGVIIQQLETNGVVRQEFVLLGAEWHNGALEWDRGGYVEGVT